MKFMKLGSKPDSFQTEGDNIRYVASELATDLVINVGDVKFYLHKFPLLSKSAHLQKLIAATNDENSEIYIEDIPGGPVAFEMCTKFCYGMVVTLNAYNVVAARCAAEYLEMHDTVEKGNLVYKIEVFLNSSIFRSWKDSIIMLQTTRSLLPWSEDLNVVSQCLDSIASKASIDTSKVEWSYTYNRKKLPSENGKDQNWNGVRKPLMVPTDWWVEDLCELHIDLYKRVIATIRNKGRVSNNVIGEALNAYAMRRLPGLNKGVIQSSDLMKYRSLAETIIWLLPSDKGSVPCRLMLKLLRAAILLECGETERNDLLRRIGQQLDTASLADLLIQSPTGETGIYSVDIVQTLVEEFIRSEQNDLSFLRMENEFQEDEDPNISSDASRISVAKLIDGYLAEISRDPNFPLSKFLGLAEMVSRFPRSTHDGIYRAIDMYLKEHPGISKSERKRICRLMDSQKLSPEARMHAVQNERLPLRVVVQVLFFEQMRTNGTAKVPGSLRASLPSGGSHGSSRSTTTNTEDDWDAVATAEDIKALKGELATLRLERRGSNASLGNGTKTNPEKTTATKVKALAMSKIFSRLRLNKERNGDSSSSDTSESPGSGSVTAENEIHSFWKP